MPHKFITILLFFVLGCQSAEINIAANKTKNNTQLQTASVFDPYGYYFAKNDLSFNGYSFEWLFIPGKPDTPSIRLRSSKTDAFADVKASNYSINEKNGSFEFNDSQKGKVLIKGKFLGRQGPMKDNVKDDEVVFQGTITINGVQTPISMTWFEGD